MSEPVNKLQELFERKESLTSKMDSFQIIKEIEQTITQLLRYIFKPYSLEEVPRRNLTRTPDVMLKFNPLGKTKNRVFFEIKARKMAYYDLKMIREMIRQLRAIYGYRFHSLVIIARSFEKEIVHRIAYDKEQYLSKITLISVDTLVELYQMLTAEPRFENAKYKQVFLADLLKTEGRISSRAIVARAKVFEEYRFERLPVEMYTRDQALLSVDLSFNAMLEDEQLFNRIVEEMRTTYSESAKNFILAEIKDYVQRRPVLEFAFEMEPTLSKLREELSYKSRQNGLRLLDFHCRFDFDDYTRSRIDESRQFLDRTKPLREEIDMLDRQLAETYSYLKTEIYNLDHALQSLNTGYIHGTIEKEGYLERIDEIGAGIAKLRAEMNRAFRERTN